MKKINYHIGLLVIVFCIILVSCESQSGNRANMPVKIVLDKHVSTVFSYKQFRVHKVGDSNVYFWGTNLPYQVGDTVSTTFGKLLQ